MADEKLVEREMLTSTYLDGVDYHRGDVVKITEEQAKAWEELDPPAVAEVGHLEKLEKERQEAEQAAQDRDDERARLDDEDRRMRQAHNEDKLFEGGKSEPRRPGRPRKTEAE